MASKKSLAQEYPGLKHGMGTSDTVLLYGSVSFGSGLTATTYAEVARFYFSEGAETTLNGNVAYLIDGTFSFTGNITYSVGSAFNAQLSLYKNGYNATSNPTALVTAPLSKAGATTVAFYQATSGTTTQATPNWVQVDGRDPTGAQQYSFIAGDYISLYVSYAFPASGLTYTTNTFACQALCTFNTFSIKA